MSNYFTIEDVKIPTEIEQALSSDEKYELNDVLDGLIGAIQGWGDFEIELPKFNDNYIAVKITTDDDKVVTNWRINRKTWDFEEEECP